MIRRIIILTMILSCLLSISVYAHPGKTDSKGGHHDYNNVSGLGSYHYHHGESAHLHENGICPYKTQKEKTIKYADDYNNVHSGSGTPKITSSKKTTNKELPLWLEIIAIFFGICFAISFLFTLVDIFLMILDEIKKSISDKKMRKIQLKFGALAEKTNYEYYFSMYSFLRPSDFCKIPKGTYIKDSMPCTHGGGIYGKYTVYITKTGKCYHEKRSCSRSDNIQTKNIVQVCQTHKTCSKCCKSKFALEWYSEWKRINDIKKRYNIP